MTDLIKRLKEAPGPSRELDAEIADLFGVAVYLMPTEFDTTAPAYTSDLNAVIALIEEKLPGVQWSLDLDEPDEPVRYSAGLMLVPPRCDWVESWRIDASHSIPAIALLIALLEAMEGRDD